MNTLKTLLVLVSLLTASHGSCLYYGDGPENPCSVTATALPVVLHCNPGLYFTIKDISVAVVNGETEELDNGKALQECNRTLRQSPPDASCEVVPELDIPESDMKSITVRYYCWRK